MLPCSVTIYIVTGEDSLRPRTTLASSFSSTSAAQAGPIVVKGEYSRLNMKAEPWQSCGAPRCIQMGNLGPSAESTKWSCFCPWPPSPQLCLVCADSHQVQGPILAEHVVWSHSDKYTASTNSMPGTGPWQTWHALPSTLVLEADLPMSTWFPLVRDCSEGAWIIDSQKT